MYKLYFQYGPVVFWVLMHILFVRRLGCSPWVRRGISAILLVASLKFFFYAVVGGDAFVPELPACVIWCYGFLYCSFLLLTAVTLCWYLVRGVLLLLPRPLRPQCPTREGVRRRAFVGSLAAVGAAGWGMWEGLRVPAVRRTEIALENLPPAFDGFRIVQLSDLHCCAAMRADRLRAIVDRVNALKPDLICITGDFVDGKVPVRAPDLAPLGDLRAAHGVMACSGNHEYYSDYRAWRPVFTALGIQMLDNEHRVLEKAGSRLVIGGVTDPVATRAQYKLPGPNRRRAFQGAPKESCRILLCHRPIGLPLAAQCGVNLQLSGHTHGGVSWGMDRLVAHLGNEGHLRGLYREGRIALYVSSGTGQWLGFPSRFGVPSEIGELVLSLPRKMQNDKMEI